MTMSWITQPRSRVNWLTLGGRDYRLLIFDAGAGVSNAQQWNESLDILNLRGLGLGDSNWLDLTSVTAHVLAIITHENYARFWSEVDYSGLELACNWFDVKEFYLSPAGCGRYYLITYSYGPSSHLSIMHYIRAEALLGLSFQYYPDNRPVPRKLNWLREGF